MKATLDGAGVLTISTTKAEGEAMPDYDVVNSLPTTPWYGDRAKIRSVTIEDKITTVGDFAFMNCGSIAPVIIPNSVKAIF